MRMSLDLGAIANNGVFGHYYYAFADVIGFVGGIMVFDTVGI